MKSLSASSDVGSGTAGGLQRPGIERAKPETIRRDTPKPNPETISKVEAIMMERVIIPWASQNILFSRKSNMIKCNTS